MKRLVKFFLSWISCSSLDLYFFLSTWWFLIKNFSLFTEIFLYEFSNNDKLLKWDITRELWNFSSLFRTGSAMKITTVCFNIRFTNERRKYARASYNPRKEKYIFFSSLELSRNERKRESNWEKIMLLRNLNVERQIQYFKSTIEGRNMSDFLTLIECRENIFDNIDVMWRNSNAGLFWFH